MPIIQIGCHKNAIGALSTSSHWRFNLEISLYLENVWRMSSELSAEPVTSPSPLSCEEHAATSPISISARIDGTPTPVEAATAPANDTLSSTDHDATSKKSSSPPAASNSTVDVPGWSLNGKVAVVTGSSKTLELSTRPHASTDTPRSRDRRGNSARAFSTRSRCCNNLLEELRRWHETCQEDRKHGPQGYRYPS